MLEQSRKVVQEADSRSQQYKEAYKLLDEHDPKWLKEYTSKLYCYVHTFL